MKQTHLYFLLALICFLASCTMEKRRYSKGYHVEWRTAHKGKMTSLPNRSEAPLLQDETMECSAELDALVFPVSVSSVAEEDNSVVIFNAVTEKTTKCLIEKKKPTAPCDTLLLMNGEVVLAKITEVRENSVQYKLCDGSNDLVYFISNTDLKAILYANNTQEVFEADNDIVSVRSTLPASEAKSPGKEERPKAFNGFSIVGLCLGVVAFAAPAPFGIPLSVLAIIFSGIAKARIKEYPDYFAGENMASWGLAAGIVSFMVQVLLLLI